MVHLILLLAVLVIGNSSLHCDYSGQTLKPVAAPSIIATAGMTDGLLTDLNFSDFNLSAWDAKIEKRWRDALNKTRLGSLDKELYQEF
jgi:hypothetical protein